MPACLYSGISGISSAELNKLEVELLRQVNFDLHVSEKEFLTTKKRLSIEARILERQFAKHFMVLFNEEEEGYLRQLLIQDRLSLSSTPQAPAAAAAAQNTTQKLNGLSTFSSPVPSSDQDASSNMEEDPSPYAHIIKRSSQYNYDEPIKYSATSDQWFYKKSDAELAKSDYAEETERANHFKPIEEVYYKMSP